MSFEPVQVMTLPGGGMMAKCLNCGEQETLFPANSNMGHGYVRAEIIISHTCKVGRIQ